MTYRKLSLSLIAAATLVLGVAWYGSLHTYYSAYLGSPAGGFALDLHRGTVSLYHYPSPGSWELRFQNIPDEELIRVPPEWTSPWGKLGTGTMEDHGIPGSALTRYLHFPIWFPYLFIVGTSYAVTRAMEKRAAARQITLQQP